MTQGFIFVVDWENGVVWLEHDGATYWKSMLVCLLWRVVLCQLVIQKDLLGFHVGASIWFFASQFYYRFLAVSNRGDIVYNGNFAKRNMQYICIFVEGYYGGSYWCSDSVHGGELWCIERIWWLKVMAARVFVRGGQWWCIERI